MTDLADDVVRAAYVYALGQRDRVEALANGNGLEVEGVVVGRNMRFKVTVRILIEPEPVPSPARAA